MNSVKRKMTRADKMQAAGFLLILTAPTVVESQPIIAAVMVTAAAALATISHTRWALEPPKKEAAPVAAGTDNERIRN